MSGIRGQIGGRSIPRAEPPGLHHIYYRGYCQRCGQQWSYQTRKDRCEGEQK